MLLGLRARSSTFPGRRPPARIRGRAFHSGRRAGCPTRPHLRSWWATATAAQHRLVDPETTRVHAPSSTGPYGLPATSGDVALLQRRPNAPPSRRVPRGPYGAVRRSLRVRTRSSCSALTRSYAPSSAKRLVCPNTATQPGENLPAGNRPGAGNQVPGSAPRNHRPPGSRPNSISPLAAD